MGNGTRTRRRRVVSICAVVVGRVSHHSASAATILRSRSCVISITDDDG